jgi:hypothetical protein
MWCFADNYGGKSAQQPLRTGLLQQHAFLDGNAEWIHHQVLSAKQNHGNLVTDESSHSRHCALRQLLSIW